MTTKFGNTTGKSINLIFYPLVFNVDIYYGLHQTPSTNAKTNSTCNVSITGTSGTNRMEFDLKFILKWYPKGDF